MPTRWHGVTSPVGADGLCPPGVSGQNARNSDVGNPTAPAPVALGGFPATAGVVPVLAGTGGGVGNGNGGIPPTDAGATIPALIGGVSPMDPPGLPA